MCKDIIVSPVMCDCDTLLSWWKCHRNIEISYLKENIFEIPQRENWNHPAEISMKQFQTSTQDRSYKEV